MSRYMGKPLPRFWYSKLTAKEIISHLTIGDIALIVLVAFLTAWFMVYAVPAIIIMLPGGK